MQQRAARTRAPTWRTSRVLVTTWVGALALAACVHIPGESQIPRAQKGEVQSRVLALAAKADPACSRRNVVHTEILDVHGDGRSAEELWVVDQCGRRVGYVVSFPQRRGGGFSVREER